MKARPEHDAADAGDEGEQVNDLLGSLFRPHAAMVVVSRSGRRRRAWDGGAWTSWSAKTYWAGRATSRQSKGCSRASASRRLQLPAWCSGALSVRSERAVAA